MQKNDKDLMVGESKTHNKTVNKRTQEKVVKATKNDDKGHTQQSFFDIEDEVEKNQEPEESKKLIKSNMTFAYEDMKEGFLMHMDLKQFISVLEKNPNTFKATIKIEKVGE